MGIGDTMPMKQWQGIFAYQGFNIFCFLLPSFIGTRLMRNRLHKASEHSMRMPTVELEKKTNERLLHSGMNYLYFYAWKGMIVSLLCGNGLDKFKLPVPTIPVFFVCGKWALGPWHTRKWKQTLMGRKDCEFKQYVDAKHWVM